MTTAPIDLVRGSAPPSVRASPDLDRLVGFFAEHAVYHNVPVDPVVGPEAIRATLASFTTGVESIEFRIASIAADGGTVLTERVDVLRFF